MSVKLQFDQIEEFAAEQLIIHRRSPFSVVYSLAVRYPKASGLKLAFALTCIASDVSEHIIGGTDIPLPNPTDIHHAVALLAADLFELSEAKNLSANGEDLLRHWQESSDKIFRK